MSAPCNCVAKFEAKLAEQNTRLALVVLEAEKTPRPLIQTERIRILRDGKRPVEVFATFCPFCGVKLGDVA
jgi:hypothetical protein